MQLYPKILRKIASVRWLRQEHLLQTHSTFSKHGGVHGLCPLQVGAN